MNSTVIALASFVLIFGCGLLGFIVRIKLSEDHLSDDSIRVISLCTGVLATMGSLVLGMMLSSAKTSFDSVTTEIESMSGKIVQLDTALVRYGPETQALRDELRRGYLAAYMKLSDGLQSGLEVPLQTKHADPLEHFEQGLNALTPKGTFQEYTLGRALALTTDLATIRWKMVNHRGKPIPMPFLAALIFWFSAIFVGFGMMTANNRLVALTLFLGAVSISTAIFLTDEMNFPFGGLISVSLEPLGNALAVMEQQ